MLGVWGWRVQVLGFRASGSKLRDIGSLASLYFFGFWGFELRNETFKFGVQGFRGLRSLGFRV